MVPMEDGAIYKLGALSFSVEGIYINRLNPLCQRLWRKHLTNLTRLRVVAGELVVFIYEPKVLQHHEYHLTQDSSEYLEISAGCWFAFRAKRRGATFLNFSDRAHDASEIIRANDIDELLTIEGHI